MLKTNTTETITDDGISQSTASKAQKLERIPVFKPYIGVDTLKHVTDAFEVGWLGMGASTKEFEEHIAAYLGLKDRFAVATNTGTSAIHLALLVAGVKAGDEVITPSFNYVSDHQAIVATGASVVFCDVRDDNLGIDVAKAEKLITDRTKAIIPLHYSGWPCDQAGVYALAEKYKLRIIEDCTHAFGTKLNGVKLGSYGDIACFSFDPVKIMTSVDGGAVIVNTEEERELLRRLRFLGVDKETTERYKNGRAWEYDVTNDGFRYHMTNILASVGISQIKRVDEFIASRQHVNKSYNGAFANLPCVRIPETDFTDVSSFVYALRARNGKRAALMAYLGERDIETGIHFIPAHRFTRFLDSRKGDLSVTERIVEEVVSLPMHTFMKQEHLDRVIAAVTSFCEAHC